MDRTPPSEVRRQLRREVGFGCPVDGCSNPYLEYHHFDPPWHVRNHHDPEGMIALCSQHHRQADAGAFTKEQLQALKSAQVSDGDVSGRFNWLRDRLLAVVGGSFYYETLTILSVGGNPAIWFNRDADGHLLLNIRMLTNSGEPRLLLEDNDWLVRGGPTDFESPPSGKRIYTRYANGDELRIEFFELATADAATQRYPELPTTHWQHVTFPIVAVEVQETIGGTPYSFGPKWTKLPGLHIKGAFMSHCGTGIAI